MDFLIPESLLGTFVGEYGTWCVVEKRKFSIIYDPHTVLHQAPNPIVTTNTSNSIPNGTAYIHLDDANGTFTDFAEAHPKWRQFEKR